VNKRLYVGNLSFKTTEDEIKTLFSKVGTVDSVNFVRDYETGRMKGFGFVEISGEDSGKVIAQFNGKEVGGRALIVNEARPKTNFQKR
jgi:cold-inducible RNA-binding protein